MWAKHILLVVLMVILNTDKVLMSEWMDSRMAMAVKRCKHSYWECNRSEALCSE